MSRPLPHVVDASVAAGRRETLEGRISVSSFTRLDGLLQSRDGDVDVVIGMRRDRDGSIEIDGRVRGALTLQCQRCLGPMVFHVDAGLSLVCTENPQQEPVAGRDLLIADPTRLVLPEMVEEELILALPLVPRHAHGEGDCRERKTREPDAFRKKELQQPFAALQELSGNGKSRSR